MLGHVHASMKTIIAYLLTCLSVVAAGTNDIRVFTTISSNTQPGILITLDTFTRDGQTNLSRDTRTKDGVLTIRNQRFYHGSSLLGEYTTYPTSNTSYSVAGAPCSLRFQYDASNHIRSALVTSNFMVLDFFPCSNGVFYPEDSESIRKANLLPMHSDSR
jgi:hypothetical protein